MKNSYIILFAIAVIVVVGIVVFSSGNNSNVAKLTVINNSSSQTGVTQNQGQEITNQPSNSSGKVTLTELSNHDSQSDCWISYNGKVYDITAFLPKHPGSAEAIAPYCGTAGEFENAFTDQHGLSQVNKLIKEGIYKGEL